jgi:hypothetical protein
MSKFSALSDKLVADALLGLVSAEALNLDELAPEGVNYPLPEMNDDERAVMCAWLHAGGLLERLFIRESLHEFHVCADSTISMKNAVVALSECGQHAAVAVEIDDMSIINPFLSECGRFSVDPVDAYGMSIADARELVRINTRIHNYAHSRCRIFGGELDARCAQILAESYVSQLRDEVRS